MDDLEIALRLQQQFNEEERQRASEEQKSIELAIKLQQEEQEAANTSSRPHSPSHVVLTEQQTQNAQNEDSEWKTVSSNSTSSSNCSSPMNQPSNLDPTYLEFTQDGESVSYDRATLSINFATKEYKMSFSKRRQQILNQVHSTSSGYLTPLGVTFSERIHQVSLNKHDLLREITLPKSKFDPVEMRVVAHSLNDRNSDDFFNINALAARTLIFNNNKSLRKYLTDFPLSNRVQSNRGNQIHMQQNQFLPVLDLHGLFLSEARARILPFFALCFDRKLRKCGLCVGIGRDRTQRAANNLGLMLFKLLHRMKSEREFSRRVVLDIDKENEGLLMVKINLDSPLLCTT